MPSTTVSASNGTIRSIPVFVITAGLAFGQAASPTTAPPPDPALADVVTLSPFVISEGANQGWVATHSLAGSRLTTDLKDIAAPIEVLTKDFMDEFGLNSIGEATIYTINVEGRGDNLELGTGQGFSTGFPPPTRIRGLGTGTLSRDFFGVQMASDNYNLERVTIASGPNNLLFGTGSPAGVIDTSLKRPAMRNFFKVETQFDTNDSQRYAVDLNRELIKGKLAARFNWLHAEKEYAYKPSGTDQNRLNGGVQYRPFRPTTITVNYEDATVHNIAPQLALPFDYVTRWFTAGKPGFANPSITGTFNTAAVTAGLFQREPAYPMVVIGSVAGYKPGDIIPVRNTVSIVNANQAIGVSPLDTAGGDWSLLDGTIVPVSTNLSGLTKLQRIHSKIANVFVTQQIGEHLFLEFAGQKERYLSWNAGLFANTSPASIQVDPNQFLVDGVTSNPNFGKLYVEGINNGPFRTQDIFKTRDWRVSGAYEWDFGKKQPSWWQQVLGRQRIAGLLSGNDTDMREQELFARILPAGGVNGVDPVINGITFRTPYAATGAAQNSWATDTSRNIQWRYYLSNTDPVPRPFADMFTPTTLIDSAGKPFTIDMMNTGLKDQYGRRLGALRENIMTKTFLRTRQVAYQGFCWDGRAALTYGWREDTTNQAAVENGYAVDAFTGFRPLIQDIRFSPYDAANRQRGRTTTKGIIVRPLHGYVKLPWEANISLGYNQSDTFQANISNFDPNGNAYPGAEGTGKDKSVRLDLFGGKFSARYTQFTNVGGPQRAGNSPYNLSRNAISNVFMRANLLAFGTANVSIDPANPRLFPALGNADPYIVTSFNRSEGREISLDWNVNKHFQLRFNLNRSKVKESNIGKDWFAYLDKYLPAYKALTYKEGGNTNPRDLDGDGRIGGVTPGAPAWTWDTAWQSDTNSNPLSAFYQSTVVQGAAGQQIIEALDGKQNEFGRNSRHNLTWVYRFTEGRLKGFSVGGAYRYRAAPLLAYGRTVINGTSLYDLTHPYYGSANNIWDLSLNYYGRSGFWRFRNYHVGVNVRNLFNADALYKKVVDINGVATRLGKVDEPRVLILSLGFDL